MTDPHDAESAQFRDPSDPGEAGSGLFRHLFDDAGRGPRSHGPPPCFAGSTPVLTAAGWVPIAEIARGDSVGAFAPARAAATLRPVLRVKGAARARIWALHTAQLDAPIRTTFAHAFLTQRGWVQCWRLRPGDVIRAMDGDGALYDNPVVSVGRTPAREPVYNLITGTDRTYAVAGAIVHGFAVLRGLRGALAELQDAGPAAAPAPHRAAAT